MQRSLGGKVISGKDCQGWLLLAYNVEKRLKTLLRDAIDVRGTKTSNDFLGR